MTDKPRTDVILMAEYMRDAWRKYFELFGCPPHGTVPQLAAMIELSPQLKEHARLFQKQRIEVMTT